MLKILAAANNSAKAKEIIENASSIMHLFFIPFAPVLLITLTFPLNDMFHIYAIGNHIGRLETKINMMENNKILGWEHRVCPKVYGGEGDSEGNQISNIITMGDTLLLVPALFLLSSISIYICGFPISKVTNILVCRVSSINIIYGWYDFIFSFKIKKLHVTEWIVNIYNKEC